MTSTHTKLQDLENELIQINGLMRALQKLLPDGSEHVCVANELESRLLSFQKQFYEYWGVVIK